MDIIKYLITEHGCDPALPDNDGNMPINIACLCGQLNVVKYLVTEMKCNPKSPGEDGRKGHMDTTSSDNACGSGHMDIINKGIIIKLSQNMVVTQHYQTMMVTCQYTLLVFVAN